MLQGPFDSTFIPYSHLSTDPMPIDLCNGQVLGSICLTKPHSQYCHLLIPRNLYFENLEDSNQKTTKHLNQVTMAVGSTFQLEYRGQLTEIRIGRPFRFTDA